MARSRGTLLDPLEGGDDDAEREKKNTNTVTVCAPEEEAGVGRLGGKSIMLVSSGDLVLFMELHCK